MKKEIKVPTAPNNMIVMKLRKNCFFFTWNLEINKIEAVSVILHFCQNMEDNVLVARKSEQSDIT